MLDKLIGFSIRNKLIVGLLTLGLAAWGLVSMYRIPVNSMPDVTSNQVSVITLSQNLSAEEVEQLITYPIELSLSNLPGVKEIRSTSRFGLSNITVVFKDDMGIYKPRQVIQEKLSKVKNKLPDDAQEPFLAPISTGLGEIYQYVLTTEEGYDSVYTARDLRTIQDWTVKRRMALTPGVAAVNSFGGDLKEYEVRIDPDRLNSMDVTISELFRALKGNNQNSGSAYIQKNNKAYYIRAEGLIKNKKEIRQTVVKTVDGDPMTVGDVAEVQIGHAKKYGAMTMNGIGEQVGGIVMMLRGANSKEVITNVKERIEKIREILPEGVKIKPFLDRSKLIDRAISTVATNLIEGGLIVIFVLVILLGSWRSGIIVGSVVPLSLLFAFIMMQFTGVRASLLSLGAIDFGIIVDGAVILTEYLVFKISQHSSELSRLTGREYRKRKDEIAQSTASEIMRSVLFGILIILVVFVPILTLTGVEGKMFKPMALTFGYAITGALLLCLTYVPMMGALLLKPHSPDKKTWGDRIMNGLYKAYSPVQGFSLRYRWLTLLLVLLLLGITYYRFGQMGANFIPTLREGDLVVDVNMDPSTSLERSKEVSSMLEKELLKFPEVTMAISRIGASEIPTDPHGLAKFHTYVSLKPHEQWKSASTLEGLQQKLDSALQVVPGAMTQINQPIQLRFNEMLTGMYQDIGVKLFGNDLDVLWNKANEAAGIIRQVDGASGVKVEQIAGLPQFKIDYDREEMAQYGLKIEKLNNIVKAISAGSKQGVIFEGEQRYSLDVKFDTTSQKNLEAIRNTMVSTPSGQKIPFKEVAAIEYSEGPAQISRDNTYRRITVGLNARGRDTESLVKEIQGKLDQQMQLPSGYYFEYGGDFENLRKAKKRLTIVVPVALLLILILLFFSLRSIKQALMIFIVVPLSAVGGVWILVMRDMTFSISGGIGFIVLFGVAVLDGSVLMNAFNKLKAEGVTDPRQRAIEGTKERFRQVILVSTVAICGFLPMATAVSTGASIQRPLSTVVIGGLISTAILTLVVLPVVYTLVEERSKDGRSVPGGSGASAVLLLIGLNFLPSLANGQEKSEAPEPPYTLEEALKLGKEQNPGLQADRKRVERRKELEKSTPDLGRVEPFYRTQEVGAIGEEGPPFNSSAFGVEQEDIAFPTVYIQRGKERKARTRASKERAALSERKLRRRITESYFRVTYRRSRLQLLKRMDSLLKNMRKAAEVRYKTGAATKLEQVSAIGKYEKVRLQKEKAQQELAQARQKLARWMNADSTVRVAMDSLEKYEPGLSLDSAQIRDHPVLRHQKARVDVARRQHKVEKNQWLPSFSLEYGNGTIGTTPFNSFRVSVGIPLWFWTRKSQVRASKLEQQVRKDEKRDLRLKLMDHYQQALRNLQKNQEELRYYRKEGLEISDELLRKAQKSYEAGDIDYLEQVQFLEQGIRMRIRYLNALYRYNLSAIEMEYLTR